MQNTITPLRGQKNCVIIHPVRESESRARVNRSLKLPPKSGNNHYQIKVTGHSKELLRVKIKGIDDRTSAERLRGTEFYVSRDVLPELDEDEYYLEDLVGLKVRLSEGGNDVGEVIGVYNFGAGDVLEVKEISGGKRNMLPFTKAFVPEVNITEGYIIVESVQLNLVEAAEEGINAD